MKVSKRDEVNYCDEDTKQAYELLDKIAETIKNNMNEEDKRTICATVGVKNGAASFYNSDSSAYERLALLTNTICGVLEMEFDFLSLEAKAEFVKRLCKETMEKC